MRHVAARYLGTATGECHLENNGKNRLLRPSFGAIGHSECQWDKRSIYHLVKKLQIYQFRTFGSTPSSRYKEIQENDEQPNPYEISHNESYVDNTIVLLNKTYLTMNYASTMIAEMTTFLKIKDPGTWCDVDISMIPRSPYCLSKLSTHERPLFLCLSKIENQITCLGRDKVVDELLFSGYNLEELYSRITWIMAASCTQLCRESRRRCTSGRHAIITAGWKGIVIAVGIRLKWCMQTPRCSKFCFRHASVACWQTCIKRIREKSNQILSLHCQKRKGVQQASASRARFFRRAPPQS